MEAEGLKAGEDLRPWKLGLGEFWVEVLWPCRSNAFRRGLDVNHACFLLG